MRDVNSRKVSITMVDGTVFNGSVNIGSSRRISDHLKKTENSFVVLFDATIGTGTEKHVYFLNMKHVLWIKPDEIAHAASDDVLTIAIESGARMD